MFIAKQKLIHSVVVSQLIHDSQVLGELRHENELRDYGDSAYTGQKKQIKSKTEKVKCVTHKRGRCNNPLSKKERQEDRYKSKIRPRDEHICDDIKHQLGY